MASRRYFTALADMLIADDQPVGRTERLERETVLPASLDHTFAFFADPSNLERLTPPWLHFEMLTPAWMVMRQGLEIDYRISLYGVPIPWRSRIDVWAPGVGFVDRQLVGPYRWWRHEHRFEAAPGGTRVIDRVEYLPRALWISGALVRRDLERIFTYRQDVLLQIFRTPELSGDRHAG